MKAMPKRHYRSCARPHTPLCAPSNPDLDWTIDYLAKTTLEALIRFDQQNTRRQRARRRLMWSQMQRLCDPGVRYLLFRGHGPLDWRFVAKSGRHVFPISLEIHTTTAARRAQARRMAWDEADQIAPPGDMCIVDLEDKPGLTTIRFGTDEEDAQRKAFIERRTPEILDTLPMPPAKVRIQWPDCLDRRIGGWRTLCLSLQLDIDEDDVATHASAVRKFAQAMHAERFVLINAIADGLSTFLENQPCNISPPNPHHSWRDVARQLYRYDHLPLLNRQDRERLMQRFMETAS